MTFNFQKIIKTMILVFLVVIIILETAIVYVGSIDDSSESEYLIILGAGLRGDQLSPILASRMFKSLEYIEKYPDVKIIVSGGQGPDELVSEAQAMHDFLIDHGIDQNLIILENQSTSTAENIKFSKEKIRELRPESDDQYKVTLVTNNFHMLRAKMLCQFNDLEVDGKPSISVISSDRFYYIREIPAFIKTIIFDMIFEQ